jgi:hypothetical protein
MTTPAVRPVVVGIDGSRRGGSDRGRDRRPATDGPRVPCGAAMAVHRDGGTDPEFATAPGGNDTGGTPAAGAVRR